MRKVNSMLDLEVGKKIQLRLSYRTPIKYTITDIKNTPMGAAVYLSSDVKSGYKTGDDGWLYADNLIRSGCYYVK